MTESGHVASYYAATAHRQDARPALHGAEQADICIIGAGYTGISAALELAERGFSVIVLEAVRVGFGASGRNGGQIVNGYSRPLDVIAARYGELASRAISAMALEGAKIIRERVAKYAIACDLVPGGLLAALSPKQMQWLEHEQHLWATHGHPGLELLDRAGLAPHVASSRYVGGLLDPLGGHLHPLNLVQGEAAAVELLGGRIFENSRALEVDTGAQPVVRTAQGEVRAKYVLVCGNAYIGDLLPELSGKIMPVSTQILATEPLGPLAESLLPSNVCVEDCNYILDYFRRSADGRILYGGGSVYGGRDPCQHPQKTSAADAQNLSVPQRVQDRLRLERQFRPHFDPVSTNGAAFPQRVFQPWRQRPWPHHNPPSGPAAGRGGGGHGIALRCLRQSALLPVSRRQGLARAAHGAGGLVLPVPRPNGDLEEK